MLKPANMQTCFGSADWPLCLPPSLPHIVAINSQPLLCISLLALLLLPLSLSCSSKRPLTEVRENYRAIVQTDLENAVSKTPILFIHVHVYTTVYFTTLHTVEIYFYCHAARVKGRKWQLEGSMPSQSQNRIRTNFSSEMSSLKEEMEIL